MEQLTISFDDLKLANDKNVKKHLEMDGSLFFIYILKMNQ